MKNKREKKEKKEKIVYVDDGSTVFDMSGLEQTQKWFSPAKMQQQNTAKRQKQPARWKAIVRTYFDSVKLMLLPMLVFIGIISIAFLLLWLAFGTRL